MHGLVGRIKMKLVLYDDAKHDLCGINTSAIITITYDALSTGTVQT